jgi:hypothetical protein
MGAWSQYPDGNDSNIDIFANFINQYFGWQEDNDENMLDILNQSDPGLMIRMGLRQGETPQFNEEDLQYENQQAFLKLLKNYSEKYDNETCIGLAISLARICNNEEFGIFVETLPNKNLLTKDINDYVLETLQPTNKNIIDFFTNN